MSSWCSLGGSHQLLNGHLFSAAEPGSAVHLLNRASHYTFLGLGDHRGVGRLVVLDAELADSRAGIVHFRGCSGSSDRMITPGDSIGDRLARNRIVDIVRADRLRDRRIGIADPIGLDAVLHLAIGGGHDDDLANNGALVSR